MQILGAENSPVLLTVILLLLVTIIVIMIINGDYVKPVRCF